jgi:hypothetical protein
MEALDGVRDFNAVTRGGDAHLAEVCWSRSSRMSARTDVVVHERQSVVGATIVREPAGDVDVVPLSQKVEEERAGGRVEGDVLQGVSRRAVQVLGEAGAAVNESEVGIEPMSTGGASIESAAVESVEGGEGSEDMEDETKT